MISNFHTYSVKGLINVFHAFTNSEFVPLVTHSLDVAKMSSALADRAFPGKYNKAFIYLTGLFHDWGLFSRNMILKPTQFSEMMNTVLFPSKDDLKSFDFMHLVDTFEQPNLMRHSEIASSLLRYIGFPQMYERGVLYHHSDVRTIQENEDIVNIAGILHTADILSLTYRKHAADGITAGFRAIYADLKTDKFPKEFRHYVHELFEDLFEMDNCIDTLSHVEEYFGDWKPDLKTFIKLIEYLSFIQDYRSPFTRNHSFSIAMLAKQIGLEMLCERDSMELYLAGLIHDFGKITIPLEILHKPGPLTECEMYEMKRHITATLKMIEPILEFKEIILTALSHHERLDGSGYPFGLKAYDITLSARILQVCDVYIALVEDRPYRPGLPVREALRFIEKEAKNNRLDGMVHETLKRLVQNGYETGKYRDFLSVFFENLNEDSEYMCKSANSLTSAPG